MGLEKSRKYAFVVPRFGKTVGGGAETLVAGLAKKLAERGDQVEVLTTCAADNRTWENFFAPGTVCEDGVTVHRFPVDVRNLDQWLPLQIRLSEGMRLSLDEQFEWMQQSVNAQGLYRYIQEEGDSFDALFFAPYLFGTTFHGSLIHPGRSYLIPCLHDECYAYIDIIASMFRQVKGALFNAIPEQDLADRLYGKICGGEVGLGFESTNYLNSERPYFKEKFPYILYLGRKETGKNAHLLVDYFIAAKDSKRLNEDVKLVFVGGGSFSDLHRPEALNRSDIIDRAHVSEEEKRALIRDCSFLCQPSQNESFSIVIMEAWLQKKPVVVHGHCAVTKWHVEQSRGGLYFVDADEFSEVARTLCSNQELGHACGEAGKIYVEDKYSWSNVLIRFDRVMNQFLQ